MPKILPIRTRRAMPKLPSGEPLLTSDQEASLWRNAAAKFGYEDADEIVKEYRRRIGKHLSPQQRDRAIHQTDENGQKWPLQCTEPGCEVLHPNAVEDDPSLQGWLCHKHEEDK